MVIPNRLLLYSPNRHGPAQGNCHNTMPTQQSGDKIIATLPGGATVVVLLWGATVISWKAASPGSHEITERFFVSSKSAMDGSKPVRLGIRA